jgi:hypothetical protein
MAHACLRDLAVRVVVSDRPSPTRFGWQLHAPALDTAAPHQRMVEVIYPPGAGKTVVGGAYTLLPHQLKAGAGHPRQQGFHYAAPTPGGGTEGRFDESCLVTSDVAASVRAFMNLLRFHDLADIIEASGSDPAFVRAWSREEVSDFLLQGRLPEGVPEAAREDIVRVCLVNPDLYSLAPHVFGASVPMELLAADKVGSPCRRATRSTRWWANPLP